MLQDRGSRESRGVNETVEPRLVLQSRRERIGERHILVVASPDETRVDLYGSGHVWQPVTREVIPKCKPEIVA